MFPVILTAGGWTDDGAADWIRARFIFTKLWRDGETSVFDIKDVFQRRISDDGWKTEKCFTAAPFENVACEVEYVHIGYWAEILTRENKIISHVNQAFSQVKSRLN